jgi:hypothetical protein
MKERKFKTLPVVGRAIAAGSIFVTSCVARINEVVSPTEVFPVDPVATETLPPTSTAELLSHGPEATLPSPAPLYPESLSVEEIREALVMGGGPLSEDLINSPQMESYRERRMAWARQSGFNVDDPTADDYVTLDIVTWDFGDAQRWDLVPKDQRGEIAGWLQIRDENIQTGWRYAERPSYDPNLDFENDEVRYGLPEMLSPDDRFEIILVNQEYKILVELDSAGNPARWLNVVEQQWETAEGAVIEPTPIPFPEGMGEIAFTEEHEGRQYAIDIYNRAVAVYNEESREWVSYTRSVEIVNLKESMADQIPPGLLEEVTPENLQRVTDSRGTPIPFGYLFEFQTYYEDGDLREIPMLSGYLLGGFYSAENPRQPWWGVLFEIPNRYTRQVLLLVRPSQEGVRDIYEFPSSRRLEPSMDLDSFLGGVVPVVRGESWPWVGALNWDQRPYGSIGQALVDTGVRGEQIFIGLDIVSDPSYPIIELREGDRNLLESLRNGESYSGVAAAVINVEFIITPAGLIPDS